VNQLSASPTEVGVSERLKIFNIKRKEEIKMNLTVTKDTLIGEILSADRTTAPYFLEIGMHCLGCPSSTGESLEEACMVHGVPVQDLLDKLNGHIAK
jgi:hybrid cluster-associated redox disulfide protein